MRETVREGGIWRQICVCVYIYIRLYIRERERRREGGGGGREVKDRSFLREKIYIKICVRNRWRFITNKPKNNGGHKKGKNLKIGRIRKMIE